MSSKAMKKVDKAVDGVIDVLKKTPLREWWWKNKKKTPFKQVRKYLGGIHKEKLYLEWFPAIYNRHSSDPIDEHKVVMIENALSGLSNSFQLIYKDLKASGDYRIHVHHLGKNLTRAKQHDINGARLANDLGGVNIDETGLNVDGIINAEPWLTALHWYQAQVNDGVRHVETAV